MITVHVQSQNGMPHSFCFSLADDSIAQNTFIKMACKSPIYVTHPRGDSGVIVLTASDESLTKITEMFGNIPYVRGAKEVTWTGETASFILLNLQIYAQALLDAEL